MDMDPTRSRKTFGFVEKIRKERGDKPDDVPLFFVSASDGSNVVALFKEAIKRACKFKEELLKGGGTFVDEVLQFIEEEEKRENGMFSKPTPTVADEPVPEGA
jgi:hypothetical protein